MTDKDGNAADIKNGAEMIKSVSISSDVKKDAVLYAALYTDGELSGISVSETHGKAGEYEVLMPVGEADTLKVFLMDFYQKPLIKARIYLIK